MNASIATRLLLGWLAFYKACLSPIAFSFCKFYPTCSLYAREAIERHGARRGLLLALGRFWRCRPLAAGGYDPVPEPAEIMRKPARG